MKYNQNLKVPFIEQNGMTVFISYDGYGALCKHTENNEPFKQVFCFQGFERGRSSAVARFVSEDKTIEATMFLSNIGDAIKMNVDLMRLEGTFVFVKKGANYGIALLEKEYHDNNQ